MHGYVDGPWVAQSTSKKFSSTEQGEVSKTTLKMKPHQVRKPFQKSSGQYVNKQFLNRGSTIRLSG